GHLLADVLQLRFVLFLLTQLLGTGHSIAPSGLRSAPARALGRRLEIARRLRPPYPDLPARALTQRAIRLRVGIYLYSQSGVGVTRQPGIGPVTGLTA